MDDKKATSKQIKLMRHACGMDSKSPGFRNHYAAEPGSDDDKAWAGMVRSGFAAVGREPVPGNSPLRIYIVTEKGRAEFNDGR
jgi:hypothetical protein